jgi:hypothetical protein
MACLTAAISMPHARAADAVASSPATQNWADGSFTGRVVETMNASRYTYIQVDTGHAKLWVAGPAFEVKVGDPVAVSGGMLMKDFQSDALKRKFEELYLAGSITIPGAASPHATPPLPAGHPDIGAASASGTPALPAGHPDIRAAGAQTAALLDFTGIQKPEGGKTVAEIWAGKSKLAGKEVVVRAKVVKALPEIMGMYWLHLRDGTGAEGQNDLTVTTTTAVKVGEVVTVTGVLSTDKDYGAGYKYEVIIDGAAITR